MSAADALQGPMLADGEQGSARANVRRIVQIAADLFRTTPALILGKSRTREAVWARHIAMVAAIRIFPDTPLAWIAVAFKRDPSTVREAFAKAKGRQTTTDVVALVREKLAERVRAEQQQWADEQRARREATAPPLRRTPDADEWNTPADCAEPAEAAR